jgi:hypothetical protein
MGPEGTGCYGAGLTRFLVDQGEWVVEIDRPTRARGRHGAKSDVLDAVRASREALARNHLTNPCQRGHREALRVLHTTRAGIVAAGADARRQLKALIVTAPEPLRDRLRGRPWRQQLRACRAGGRPRRSSGAPGHHARAGPNRPASPGRPTRRQAAEDRTGPAHHGRGPGPADPARHGPDPGDKLSRRSGADAVSASTWKVYGHGGDIHATGDAILAAARLLRANGAPADMAAALYAYNPSRRYVRAHSAYASQLRANRRAFLGCYHWQVFHGDTLLPEGYPARPPVPAPG